MLMGAGEGLIGGKEANVVGGGNDEDLEIAVDRSGRAGASERVRGRTCLRNADSYSAVTSCNAP